MAATMEAAMFNMHACVCTCACGVPPPNPAPITHPPTPLGGTPQISKNMIRLEGIEIFRFRLKIWNLWRIPYPWCVDVVG